MKQNSLDWNYRKFSDFYPYLFGAEITLKRHFDIGSKVVFLALGIREEGTPEILGYCTTKQENKKETYMKFLNNLLDRGIRSPLLWTGPNGSEFTESVMDVFRRADLQHCVRQRIFSALETIDDLDQELFKLGLSGVFRQKNIGCFLREMNHFRSQWENIYSDLTDSLEENMTFLMTFFKFPGTLHPFIKSSFLLHPLIRQISSQLNIDPKSSLEVDQWLQCLCYDQNQFLANHPIQAFKKVSGESAMISKEKYHTIFA